MAVTQNEAENNYRVSIRSRSITINEVAQLFHGGGHAYASGATLQQMCIRDSSVTGLVPDVVEKALQKKINLKKRQQEYCIAIYFIDLFL